MVSYNIVSQIEKLLVATKFEVNDPSILAQIDDNSWFMGLFYGLIIDDQLVCAIPAYRSDPDDKERYIDSIRASFNRFGTYKKLALYRNSNNKVIAVEFAKSFPIRTSQLDRTGSPSFEPFDSPKKKIMQLKLHIEKELDLAVSIGSLVVDKDSLCVKLIYIFNRKKVSNEIILNLVNVISAHGELVAGELKFNKLRQYRLLRVMKYPKCIAENLKLQKFHIGLFEDIQRNKFLNSTSKMMRKKILVSRSKLIGEHYEVGQTIDIDWFGREFGFFINSAVDNKVHHFSAYPTRKQVL